jgi:hypothetical protein
VRGKALPVVAALLLVASFASTAAAASPPGFQTARPTQLVPCAPGDCGPIPVQPGVVIDPILSTGDVVPGTTYQMSGIPDGLGAYKDAGNTVHVLMNHELGRTFPASPAGVDARISKITINRQTRGVLAATYLFNGTEGFERFCSSTLEVINGTPYYLTGEEAIGVSPAVGHDGSSIVMNAETGQWWETPHFGHLQHENVVPVERLSKAVAVTTDDDFNVGRPAYLYAYIADSPEAALSGDPAGGSLYVWKALEWETETAFTLDKGETIAGEFVPITQAENANSTTIKTAATGKHAFRFARLEDAATAQQYPGRLYFADTGKVGEATLRGRIYQLDIDPADPTKASLSLVLDGDPVDVGGAGDDIFNPDNLDTSSTSIVIQEDREAAFRDAPSSGGWGRVLVYDISSRTLRAAARVNTPLALRRGTWESSGVINAQTLLGGGWWFVDVQAHSTFVAQPGPAARPGVQPPPNTGTGEDGQLLAIYIPGS